MLKILLAVLDLIAVVLPFYIWGPVETKTDLIVLEGYSLFTGASLSLLILSLWLDWLLKEWEDEE